MGATRSGLLEARDGKPAGPSYGDLTLGLVPFYHSIRMTFRQRFRHITQQSSYYALLHFILAEL
jgi:hypothetical protein